MVRLAREVVASLAGVGPLDKRMWIGFLGSSFAGRFIDEVVRAVHPSNKPVTVVEKLYFLVPFIGRAECQRLVEIAGEEAAVKIGLDFSDFNYRRLFEPAARSDMEFIPKVVRNIRTLLQRGILRDPLLSSDLGRAADELEKVASFNRGRGRPLKAEERLLAACVAGRLKAAGLPVSADPGGSFAELLGLLLGVENPSDRLVRHGAAHPFDWGNK